MRKYQIALDLKVLNYEAQGHWFESDSQIWVFASDNGGLYVRHSEINWFEYEELPERPTSEQPA